MGLKQVEKVESAADALRQEYKEYGNKAPDMQLWLVSTGGFTEDVLDCVSSRDDIYASDYDGINSIFRAFGGSYTIPVFAAGEWFSESLYGFSES